MTCAPPATPGVVAPDWLHKTRSWAFLGPLEIPAPMLMASAEKIPSPTRPSWKAGLDELRRGTPVSRAPEAAIDWSCNVVHYNRTGILTNHWSTASINLVGHP